MVVIVTIVKETQSVHIVKNVNLDFLDEKTKTDALIVNAMLLDQKVYNVIRMVNVVVN